MSAPSGPDASALTKAGSELSQLQQQTSKARADLARVLHDVQIAEDCLDNTQLAQLATANEKLVLASLNSQIAAEDCYEALQEARQSTELDALTKLPTHAVMLDRFTQAIAAAKRHDSYLALLCLDLTNFKQINEALSQAVGDQVLQKVAGSLAQLVREDDTVSRHGSDEFLILLPEVSQPSDAVLVANKLIEALDCPRRVGEHVLRLTASIGVSVYPDDGEDAETLIDRADAAMRRAQAREPGSFGFHVEPTPDERSLQAPTLESLQTPLKPYELPMAKHESRLTQLREANGQLVLAALSAQELQAAAEQARRKQTEFLGVLAHELRHPLAPIRNAAAILGKIPGNEPMLAKLQAVIDRQVEHMSRLVSDLLDISRVSSGKLRLERQIVEMAGIIDEAVEACRPAMDMHLQKLCVQVPPRAMRVDGDPVRLAQILSNLLDNASKYTPEGGSIVLSVQVEGQALVIVVSDSGIGITAQALPHVFDPFVQDLHATAFNSFGLGIGLTVVRELVEAHGGSVVASSGGNGQGSQFTVTLPLHGPPDMAGNGPA